MAQAIRKAVFPVAGLGTRFLPATKAMPKEMLPVVDRPLIQYAVDEARAAGIEEFVFVTGRAKSAIEDHFDAHFELEHSLASKGKNALLETLSAISPKKLKVTSVVVIYKPAVRLLELFYKTDDSDDSGTDCDCD